MPRSRYYPMRCPVSVILDQARVTWMRRWSDARQRAHALTLALVLSVLAIVASASDQNPRLLLARAEDMQAHCD